VDEEMEASAEPLFRDIVGTLREPVAVGDHAVETALAQIRREALRARWWRRGRIAAGAAAAFVLAVIGARRLRHPPAPDNAVTFALAAPAASRVALIGDFNDWNPDANPLRQGEGQWSVTLKLKPGRYRYSFVVDGSSWQADPGTPPAEDDFGTPTSAITVAN